MRSILRSHNGYQKPSRCSLNMLWTNFDYIDMWPENWLFLNFISSLFFVNLTPSQTVTNYYLVGKLSTSLNLSSYLVSSWSKSLSISGGDSSCSWVLVHALGLIVKEEFKSVMLGGGWRCGELLVSSSTFTVIQRIRKSVPPQKDPHWKNTNTQLQYSLYCYSLDWWW